MDKTMSSEAWVRGWLAPYVWPNASMGVSQNVLMALIQRALTQGMDPAPLEQVEMAISITDDAIDHMMRTNR